MNKILLSMSLVAISSIHLLGDVNFTQSDDNVSKFKNMYITPQEEQINSFKDQNSFIKMSNYEDKFKIDINKTAELLNKTNLKQTIEQKRQDIIRNNENNVSGPSQVIQTQEFKKEFAKYTDMILNNANLVDKKAIFNKKEMEIIKDEVSKYAVLNKEKIFIVLSSSMPDHAIKEYFKRLDGIEGVDFVFRGILHNDLKSFRPMMEYIQFLLKKDSNGGYEKSNLYNVNISINPKVTQKYNITKVPALIYIQNYDPTLEDSKALSQSDNTKEKVWIEYGLISPQYVLNKINKTAKSEWINSILYKDSYFKDKKKKTNNGNVK